MTAIHGSCPPAETTRFHRMLIERVVGSIARELTPACGGRRQSSGVLTQICGAKSKAGRGERLPSMHVVYVSNVLPFRLGPATWRGHFLGNGRAITCLLVPLRRRRAGAAARQDAAIPAADAVVGKQGDRREKRDDWHLHAIIVGANVPADHCALPADPRHPRATTRRTNRR
jgi:hypothetical protein